MYLHITQILLLQQNTQGKPLINEVYLDHNFGVLKLWHAHQLLW